MASFVIQLNNAWLVFINYDTKEDVVKSCRTMGREYARVELKHCGEVIGPAIFVSEIARMAEENDSPNESPY
jgi:hypothetical protein